MHGRGPDLNVVQARTLGDVLVVGVNPDDEIQTFKGPPVMNDDERCSLVEAVKWVDEIIPSMHGQLLLCPCTTTWHAVS